VTPTREQIGLGTIGTAQRCREGIEGRHYLAESKYISENPNKVTLKFDTQKAWLLMDISGVNRPPAQIMIRGRNPKPL
jgi:hypothetical protein